LSASFLFAQLLNGLAHASTLFVMAAGLSLIFGLCRIVNFAHGSFYMFGALCGAQLLTQALPSWASSPWLYALGMLLAALAAAALGALVERLLLRRLYDAPELYQLVATFGLTLFLHDVMLATWGATEVFAPRFPGLGSAIQLGEHWVPQWQLVNLAVGPLVWLGLHTLLTRSRLGSLLRATAQDREILGTLGVNTRPLLLLTVALGCGLAGLAGAMRLPVEPAHLQMDVQVVVETFVVVVMGGLGSISGAFMACVLLGLVHALALSFFPQLSLVLVFLLMALVLVFRPHGLAGLAQAIGSSNPQPSPTEGVAVFVMPRSSRVFALQLSVLCLGTLACLSAGDYWRNVAADALIMLLLGLSLQSMMALSGLASFGHAAYFGLGAYGAALAHLHWGAGLGWSILAGSALALLLALLLGRALVRSQGVYLAMLSLAVAQMLWALASQWTAVSGGDNGLIGLQLQTVQTNRKVFDALLLLLSLSGIFLLRLLARSRWGAALQAQRDAPQRAAASGLNLNRLRFQAVLVSATWAGLAGAMFAAHHGAVFPSVLSVATSVDALLVVLLGGLHQLWGALLGSTVLAFASAELGRGFDYWRGALGLLIMLLMVAAPQGLMAGLQRAVQVCKQRLRAMSPPPHAKAKP
jgi:branched-chain amino acid transport system permease protein